ncbi:hypothetical protein Lal_00043138 [Lupinus albus]|uniref:Putative transcription factor MADS-type1 family n=1 Tax=Lupinus albus TaxID=3870 RepID=A0A6A5P0V5_LUPAL|nr:putative transcription factor MADS-type1 family [Lupinus albus]KAF1890759.1 hypothetical protein Lal_00043138 [Lupinus albus]
MNAANDSNSTQYMKLKNKLIKQTSEISTLDGTDACVIIYGPNQPRPEIWSSRLGVQGMINKFKAMPKLERTRNMFNRESFLKKMLTKTLQKLENLKKENMKRKIELLMFQCMNSGSIVNNNASNVDMNDLVWAINQNLKDVDGENGVDETEHGTIMALNGAEALNGEGANVGVDGKGMIEANMGVVENEDLASDFGNDGGDAALAFGDDCLSNESENGSSTP